MKRAAAILGPTPPFIRWAIEAPCPFLRMPSTNASRSPAQTRWRQLRSLKEVSRARAEGRVHSGYCFSSDANPANVVGVRIDEVTAPLGGTKYVEASCQHCSANPRPDQGQWAPCTGLLPLVTPRETLLETEQAWAEQLNWLDQKIAAVLGDLGVSEDSPEPLNWHLAWQGPSLDSDRLKLAIRILDFSAERFPHAAFEYSELRAGLEHADRQAMNVWIEPVPIGWSDGQTWQLPAHCQICGAIWRGSGAGICSSCRSASSYQAERRLKVLGLRPFVQLSSVLGSESAQTLFTNYQSAKLSQLFSGQGDDLDSGR
ncbi:MAG: hypothetical protein ACKO81_05245 [Planctomycetota bacterium]